MFRFYSPHGTDCRVSVVGKHTDGMLNIAVSRCSKKDNFNRKIGRSIAEGRLKRGYFFSQIPIDECDSKAFVEIAKTVANEVCSSMIVKKEQM